MKPTPALLDKLVCWNTSRALTCILTVISVLNLDSVGTIPTANSPVTPPVVLPLPRDDYSGQSQEPVRRLKSEWDWDLMDSVELNFVPLNHLCTVDENFETVICKGLKHRADLPRKSNELHSSVRTAVFLNISSGGDLKIQDFHHLFPHLISLSICQSPEATQKFMHDLWAHHSSGSGVNGRRSSGGAGADSSGGIGNKRSFSWSSVRHLNLSGNELQTNSFPFSLMKVFPNLTKLHLGQNNITSLTNIPRQSLYQLQSIDLSGKKNLLLNCC